MNKHEEHVLLKTTSIIKMCTKTGKLLGSATCFFCKNNDNIYFITNNHVIEKSNYCYLYLTLVNKESNTAYCDFIFCELENHIVKHPSYDLCIVNITDIYNKLIAENKTPIITYVPFNKIVTNFDDFNHIEEIYMVGYPNKLISCDINYPIVRKGITATGLCDTLNDKDAFIIDIPVYGGSSGSPIYYISNNNKVKLVGVVAKKYYEKNYLCEINNNVVQEDEDRFVEVPNGLGYAIKSKVILELLNNPCKN